jgi:DNA-binding SARP family transcriptional activator
VPGVSDGAPPVWVQLLGPVRARRGGQQLSLGPRQQQLVLAVLALRAGTAVSREELVDAVWDRAPGSAVNGVHKYVHGLRSALEPGGRGNPARVLVSVSGGYELRLAPGQLDAAVFAGHRQAARRSRAAGDPARAARHLAAGLALWQGNALSGIGGQWAHAQAQRLAEARLSAVEEHTEVRLALGRHGELTGELAGLVAAHPLREGLWSQLILALYRCGQRAQALAAYHDARRTLISELGVEPERRLTRLYQQVLAADPQLDLPSPAVALLATATPPQREPSRRPSCPHRPRGQARGPGRGQLPGHGEPARRR